MALPAPSPATTALVTGASSGIGAEFARQLAVRGHGLTLVARRADRLERLAEDLRAAYGRRVEVAPADLADRAERDRLVDELDARGLDVGVLVNNAGFGIYKPLHRSDPDSELQQLAILVEAVLHLDALFVPRMVARRSGAVINVSSTAGFQALPGNGTYAAAKAYVLLHTEALAEELRDTGVTVTAVCPGPVRTEFQETSQPLFADRLPSFVWCSAERVARDGLGAAERGRRTVVPGGPAVKALFGPNRSAPAKVALPVARWIMRRELAAGR